MKNIIITHSITNTTDKWLLVGNAHEVIAAYDSLAEANADIDARIPSIEDSKWGSARILQPGEEWTGKFTSPRPLSKAEEIEEKEAFQKAAKDLPWMQGTK